MPKLFTASSIFENRKTYYVDIPTRQKDTIQVELYVPTETPLTL